MEEHDGFRTPMSGLGAAGRLLRRDAALRRVGGDQPVQLPDGAVRRSRPAARSSPATPWCSSPRTRARLLGCKLYECYRDGGVPAGAFHFVTGPRRRSSGDAPRGSTPTWTASPSPAPTRSGWRSTRTSRRTTQARHLRDGRQEPDDRHEERRPRQGGRRRVAHRRSASAGRSARRARRVYVEREVYDDFVDQLKTKTEKIKVGNPLERDVYLGPIINEPAVETLRGGVGGGARRTARSSPAASASPRATSARGDCSSQPTVVEAPEDSWLWKNELFVPFVAVAPVRLARRRDREGERHRVRADGGLLLSEDERRGRGVARPDPGRRRVREPAGRRHHRRVAGRAAVRRLEGIGHHGQGRRRPLLRHAVHA